MRDGLFESANLRLCERSLGRFIIAAGIFAAWPERQLEKARRHFVVLRIRFQRVKRDRIMRHFPCKSLFRRRLSGVQTLARAADEEIDSNAQYGIRKRRAFYHADG